MSVMDPETHSYLRDRIGAEYDVPQPLRDRLSGQSARELKADAEALVEQLGIGAAPARQRARAADGRFTGAADVNAAIRRAAGHDFILGSHQGSRRPCAGRTGADDLAGR
jgi:hypothetical protein